MVTIADDEGKVHGEVPPALSLMPDLDSRESYYLNAFDRLAGSRNIGMGAGNIPLSEIIRYGEHLDEEDMDAFIIIIQRADNAYLTANRPQAAST